MKTVNVYEVSQTQRVLEANNINEIPVQEWFRNGGQDWGNPGGGEHFIRYSLPVSEIRESWVDDGFTHTKRAYVAIGPRLLELLGPVVNDGLARLNSAKSREIEDLLISQKAHLAAIDRHRTESLRAGSNADMQAAVAQNMSERIGNFREANVLSRIWRAIKRAI